MTSKVLVYIHWELKNMAKYIWFNIGQKGLHMVTWQTAVIRDDFDISTIRFVDCDYDENNNPIEKWVSLDEMSYSFHESVAMSFADLNKVAEWVKTSYENGGEDIYVGNNNWVHIYNVFDMDDVNEYGMAKALWD